jgi:pyridoxine kinase
MARILSISSQVVRGHVGNSASVPALQRLGHEVWAMPTVVLSNHPGHRKASGVRIPPETMLAMAAALQSNGWLTELDAVSTGYLPSAAHAQAVRDTLLPLASIATPNRFELAWLSGLPVTDATSAAKAARTLGVPMVLATSVPGPSGELVNLLWSPTNSTEVGVPRLAKAPHGTGDLLAAFYLGTVLKGGSGPAALRSAVASVRAAIEASAGADELQLTSLATLRA